jgi:hypothetical protein
LTSQNHPPKKSVLDVYDPLHAFGLILTFATVIILISLPLKSTPAGIGFNHADAAGGCKEPGHINSGSCDDVVDCCLQWVSGSDPRCDDPGPGGGCCLSYGEKCNDPVSPPSPPTIIGSLNCSQWGSNDWCIDSLNLNLVASDPQGQAVIISGMINGISFACPNGNTSCTIPITTDRAGTATYTVNSATGLSASGSLGYKLDATTPQIDGSLIGAPGSNDWYVSGVSASASATDATSGISYFEYSLNGSPWTPYTSGLSLSDGVYVLNFRTGDNAGNQDETSQNFRIDTITPNLDLSITGANGNNGWYLSDVQVTALASDSGSGVTSLEYTIDGSPWASYGGPLMFTHGAHSLSVRAMDAAGNAAQADQQINVDTVTPSISLFIAGTPGQNGWYVSNIEVTASSSDAGSGLASFEYSLNDGAWAPYANSLPFAEGRHGLKFRAIDIAGNITTTPSRAYSIDTTPPLIDLPKSSKLGETVEFSAQDQVSGLSVLRVVIEDENERWPKVAWDEDPSGATHHSDFQWDGKFKDGLRAPEGTYYATVRASDVAGNESRQTVSIAVEDNLWNILLPSFSPPVSSPVPLPIAPAAEEGTNFGGGNNANSAPTQTGNVAAGGVSNAPASELGTVAFGTVSTTKANNSDASSILWGAAAAAAIGAFVAEIERKKEIEKEADKAARLETLEKLSKKQGDGLTYKQRAKAYQASLNSYQAELIRQGYSAAQAEVLKKQAVTTGKISNNQPAYTPNQRLEAEETKWLKETDQDRALRIAQIQEAVAQKKAEQQAGLAAYYAATVAASSNQTNWWENTKSFVKNNIIDPLDTYVYQPIIKPASEKIAEAVANGVSWANETIYQPFIQPAIEKAKEDVDDVISWANTTIYQPHIQPAVEKSIAAVTSGITWVTENVYQPHIQLAVEKSIEAVTNAIAWVNENVYQPYIQPAAEKTIEAITAGISWLDEMVYEPYVQPYLQPLLDKTIEAFENTSSWMDENIYQPIIQPVVNDIDRYIYQPLVQQTSAWWDKYGEWVHGSLDAVGYIPGLGEIADGVNGLIYLGEGNYIEASIAAVAMIPILGDLGKVGKWGVKLGTEVLEEAAEKVAKEVVEEVIEKGVKETVEELVEETVEETAQELVEKTVRETAENTAEVALKESSESLASKTSKEFFEEGAERTVKETGEELTEKTVKESAEKVSSEATGEVATKASKEVTGDAMMAAPKTSVTVAKEAAEETLEQVNRDALQVLSTLTEQYGEDTVARFLPLCDKYGINPADVLSKPPAEGQSLIGWVLGIDNPANPVNHPLKSLDLTEGQLADILQKSIVRPDSKVVVLGFGNGVEDPYYILSERIKACHLSLSSEDWAPFETARANFWADINARFLEAAIEERKLFIFNIGRDVIEDSANVRRFSLPEWRLIELEKNNYVPVSIGDYTALVPAELLETYEQYLPKDLLKAGG